MRFGIEKLTLLRKKCNWKVLVLTKLSNAGALEYALQDAPKSTFLWHNGAYSIMIRFLWPRNYGKCTFQGCLKELWIYSSLMIPQGL